MYSKKKVGLVVLRLMMQMSALPDGIMQITNEGKT